MKKHVNLAAGSADGGPAAPPGMTPSLAAMISVSTMLYATFVFYLQRSKVQIIINISLSIIILTFSCKDDSLIYFYMSMCRYLVYNSA